MEKAFWQTRWQEGKIGFHEGVPNQHLRSHFPDLSLKAGAHVFVPFCGTMALTSKFVPNMLAGGKAVGVFLHAMRLDDGSGYKVVLEAAPEDMYSTDTETSAAAMSKVVEKYVRAYPSQYMWTMKRFKKRPEGEARWY